MCIFDLEIWTAPIQLYFALQAGCYVRYVVSAFIWMLI